MTKVKTFGSFLIEKLQIKDVDWAQIGLNPMIENMRISNGEIGQEDFCVPKKILSNDEIRLLIKEYFKEIGGLVTFKKPISSILDFNYRTGGLEGNGVITPLNDRTLITIIPHY